VPSPYGRAILIANPRDGRGVVGRHIPEIDRVLSALDLDHLIIQVNGVSDATTRARRALEDGATFLVAVGGDHTINGVVNGMLSDDRAVNPEAILGVVSAGSGADFPTTFGLPGDVKGACTHLDGDNVFPVDLGKMSCRGSDPDAAIRYFANVAEVGMGAAALSRAHRFPERLGRSREFLGFWSALARCRPSRVSVRAGEQAFDGQATDVVVANAQYHRGGMRISPRSWPGDGLLDVLVMTGPRSDAFTLLPKIYRGDHLPHPNIVEMKGRTIDVDVARTWPVEADGRPVGVTPARFEVIREPIRLKI
jgi:diacylglycerol kinase (ATP)